MSVPSGPAAADPATARSLRRYRRRARALLLLSPLMLAGFVLAASSFEGSAEELLKEGKRVPGNVVSYSPGRLVGDVEVEYAIAGKRYREHVQLNDQSPRYQAGDPVTIIYDPDDPERIRTPTETNQSPIGVWATILLLVGGIVVFISGLVSVRRGRRWAQVLAGAEWAESQFRHERGRQRERYTLDDGRVFDVGASWRFFIPTAPRGTLWVAEAQDGRAVAATPGPGRLIAVTRRPS